MPREKVNQLSARVLEADFSIKEPIDRSLPQSVNPSPRCHFLKIASAFSAANADKLKSFYLSNLPPKHLPLFLD